MAAALSQNVISKVRGSASFVDYPELNIIAANLGKNMITITEQGDDTHAIPTATTVVNSPEPYKIVEFSADIVRSQDLANRFKLQKEKFSVLGDATLRTDAAGYSDYKLTQVSIKGIDAIKMNGEEVGNTIHFQGVYAINSDLFTL
jgi:hypothetical protein